MGRSRVTVAVFAVSALFACALVLAEPYRPVRDDVVLIKVTSNSRLRTEMPRSPEALVEAAEAEIAQGRASLDERHFGRAEALLRQALPCVVRAGAEVRVDDCKLAREQRGLFVYADLLQHSHDFANAERVLSVVLEAEPALAQARLLRASVHLARGEPRLALSDCSRLVGSVDVDVSTACIAQSIGTAGRLGEAVRLLSTVVGQSTARGQRTGWAFGILADLLERQGKYAEAIGAIERALDADPDNVALRIQAVDLLLRHERAGRVLELLERMPAAESVVLRRALAAQALSHANASALRNQWLTIVGTERRLGLASHDRDRAVGELRLMERPQEALKWAASNWRTSRDIEDARILVLAANAASQPQAAEPALDWMSTYGVEDALVNATLGKRQ